MKSLIFSKRGLPPPLCEAAERHWGAYREAAAAAGLAVPSQADFLKMVHAVWACSDFVATSCVRQPELLYDLLQSGDLLRDYLPEYYARRLRQLVSRVRTEEALAEVLRAYRRREMVRIAWRDLAGWTDLEQVVRDLSALADACLNVALESLHAWHSREFGVPHGHRSGAPQSLVVVGMGKLGARELNFSSDIDLIFAYPEDGETRGRRRRITNEEYFVRLGQRLINAIDAATADGIVFRMDMRLRPFGASGPLAVSFDAMEDYYQTHGRGWERYAWVKARIVAGDRRAGADLLALLRPFVYRRYLDYGSFEALRDMKRLIVEELQRKGMEDNIKLGAGGIREVEFIGQAFQLIRGGREPRLQERRILRVLELLGAGGHLPEYAVRELTEAYVFLRTAEHRLQEFDDQQTHSLPADPLERLRLAWSMGHAGWDGFEKTLRDHMRRVHSRFEQVFASPQAEPPAAGAGLPAVWHGSLDLTQACAVLSEHNYAEPAEALRLIEQLRQSGSYQALSRQGRERMDSLMPLLLGAIGGCDKPDACLLRLINLVEAIARRTAYLVLLVENPLALSQLVKLCAASPWIADLLTEHPLLLDELLDPRSLYAPLDRRGLEAELAGELAHAAPEDLEQQMEVLRHFKQSNVLRVAAADVMGILPLMRVSDHLTAIAEVVLGEVLRLAWDHLAARHGEPRCRLDGKPVTPGFAVVAYGKLGGIELGYGSDLDLVFLHGSAGGAQHTAGPKSIDNGQFFARLGQRIVHILNSHTPSGVLYEVDTRLRPSGASGLLVSSIEAFRDYQSESAWTWEHQALARARAVAGDAEVGRRFEAVRRDVLARKRDPHRLRGEVRAMRERMRAELGSREQGRFDLKQDHGGIADIEFMVQYGALLWSRDHPELLRYTDNIRLLDTFAGAGLVAAADAKLLADAYRAYRARVHRLTLQGEPALADDWEYRELRAGVTRIWEAMFEGEG